MKPYPDRRAHMQQCMEDAAEGYLMKIAVTGEQISQEETDKVAERAIEEANADYKRQCEEVHAHNVAVVELRHRERMNKIKQEGATIRLYVCPAFGMLFAVWAWFASMFGLQATFCVCIAAVLFFNGMLIGGAIFDRQVKV